MAYSLLYNMNMTNKSFVRIRWLLFLGIILTLSAIFVLFTLGLQHSHPIISKASALLLFLIVHPMLLMALLLWGIWEYQDGFIRSKGELEQLIHWKRKNARDLY